jgi:metal-responsive CopG/Arc/MetJ family transcriptional regulator
MGRLRKDQVRTPMHKFSVNLPDETVKALNATADAKGLTRSALITQILIKATKTKKSREE